MKKLLLLLCLPLLFTTCNKKHSTPTNHGNNNSSLTWWETFGGTSDDYGYLVQQTTDGGYIIVGSELIKTDSIGREDWSNENIRGHFVEQTEDGGYIISSTTTTSAPYLIKTDEDGDISWTKDDFHKDLAQSAYSVQQTEDGEYIFCGSANSNDNGESDVYLIKIKNDNGDSSWTKTIDCNGDVNGYSVQQTTDKGYIITGEKSGAVYLIKTDEDGDTSWTKTFEGGHIGYSVVQQTDDGDYIITGFTENSLHGTRNHIRLIQIDGSDPGVFSEITFPSFCWANYGISVTADEGYIITGVKLSSVSGTDWDVSLTKTDSQGKFSWNKTFGGTSDDYGYSVQQTDDKGYIIAGKTMSYGSGGFDVYLMKIDDQGNVASTFNIPTQ